MHMNSDEIVVRYRQAKKKREQIKILAELNACSTDDIIDVLVDNGITRKQLGGVFRAEKAETKEEPTHTEQPTAIDNALSVIKSQIDEINAQISVLEQRKQAIIDKLKDIFPDVAKHEEKEIK